MDAQVLRHDCFKIDGDTVSGKDVAHHAHARSVVSGDTSYADIRRSSIPREVVSNESAVTENASFLFRSSV